MNYQNKHNLFNKAMNFLNNIKRLFIFPSNKILLGRWKIDDYKKTILKINYANVDNSVNLLCNDDNNDYIYMMVHD